MKLTNHQMPKAARVLMGSLLSGAMLMGFIGDCDDRLVALTAFVDPCQTVLADCQPGDFQTQAADVGDFCIDPTCTIPGGCDNGQALGTVTDLCP